MYKKVLALTASLVLAIGSLAGCSDKKETTKKKKGDIKNPEATAVEVLDQQLAELKGLEEKENLCGVIKVDLDMPDTDESVSLEETDSIGEADIHVLASFGKSKDLNGFKVGLNEETAFEVVTDGEMYYIDIAGLHNLLPVENFPSTLKLTKDEAGQFGDAYQPSLPESFPNCEKITQVIEGWKEKAEFSTEESNAVVIKLDNEMLNEFQTAVVDVLSETDMSQYDLSFDKDSVKPIKESITGEYFINYSSNSFMQNHKVTLTDGEKTVTFSFSVTEAEPEFDMEKYEEAANFEQLKNALASIYISEDNLLIEGEPVSETYEDIEDPYV